MTLILPQGTRLYKIGTHNNEQSFFHLVLHPSESCVCDDAMVSIYELKTPVALRWCIGRIMHTRLYTAGPMPLEHCLLPNHDKSSIQCIIQNDPVVIQLVETVPIQMDWSPARIRGETIVPKHWGCTYPVQPIQPAQISLHVTTQRTLQTYQAIMEKEDPDGSAFSILLKRATIVYS